MFSSSKCSLFHNSIVFGSCVIHILYTGCVKTKKNNSGSRRLKFVGLGLVMIMPAPSVNRIILELSFEILVRSFL